MASHAHKVETMPRLARWRINSFPSNNYLASNNFKIGNWNWCFYVQKNQNLVVGLFPVSTTEDSIPIASLYIRIVSILAGHKTYIHPEVRDKRISNTQFFVWELLDSFTAPSFIIDVEFLDLKTATLDGGEPRSVWGDGFTQKDTNTIRLSALARMLSESIHTDITISASDGSIGAHRAVLAARSPVFHSMFSHDLKEKDTSTISISDMSIEACKTFLNYIYSNLQHQDLFNHRLDLLIAADKYDISDLKDVCEESLIGDVDTKNVLERLQCASMYKLPKLKGSCIKYLVKFCKIYDISEEFDVFLQTADRELIGEVVKEVFSVWKGF